MQIKGLENRIKNRDTYLEKVRRRYNPDGNTYEIKDIPRYTYTSDAGSLSQKTLSSIEKLKEMGYTASEVKNYWLDKNNPYNGINTVITSPNGQKFELQYHTHESYAVKRRRNARVIREVEGIATRFK